VSAQSCNFVTWRSDVHVHEHERTLIFLSINGLGVDIRLGKALYVVYVNIPILRVYGPVVWLINVTP